MSAVQSGIAERLKLARERAGLSQGQAARLLGLHRPTISTIESGERVVKASEINLFADLYRVDSDWLLTGKSSSDEETIRLVARELSKLSGGDLAKVLSIVRSLKKK